MHSVQCYTLCRTILLVSLIICSELWHLLWYSIKYLSILIYKFILSIVKHSFKKFASTLGWLSTVYSFPYYETWFMINSNRLIQRWPHSSVAELQLLKGPRLIVIFICLSYKSWSRLHFQKAAWFIKDHQHCLVYYSCEANMTWNFTQFGQTPLSGISRDRSLFS